MKPYKPVLHSVPFMFVIAILFASNCYAGTGCKFRSGGFKKTTVSHVSILNPRTLKRIDGFQKVRDNAVFDLANVPDGQIVLKARMKRRHKCKVKSVRFAIVSGAQIFHTSSKPYLFGGDKNRDFSWRPEPGTYKIEVTPYRRKKARGRSGKTRTITLTIIDSNIPDPPVLKRCSAGADKVISSASDSVTFTGYCDFENIQDIRWRYLSGAATHQLSGYDSLTPTASGLFVGIHHFELTLVSDEGTFSDTVWVAVSNSRSNYNFTANIVGPEHVVAGHSAYYDLELQQTAGGQERVLIAVDGLPEGSSAQLPDLEETCCSDDRDVHYGWDLQDTLLQIKTSTTTPPGDYLLLVTIGSGGKIKTLAKQLTVESAPAELTGHTVANVPSIPLLSQWQDNMATFGTKWCTDPTQQTNWEGNVWYYDGTRVFYQIADYFRNNNWANCLDNTLLIYRNQIFSASPGIQGWRVFPHGLYRHFQETGDTNSREAIVRLANNSSWASYGGSTNADFSRETAYIIHAYMYQYRLGLGLHDRFERAIDFALGHLEQLTRSRSTPKVKPFMLGLTFEALISYYEETGDVRVPIAIKQAADWLWDDSGLWNSSAGAFLYINGTFPGEDPPDPAPDLNLLVAPVYAWLYHKTGDDRYRIIGDTIFSGGVSQDLDNDGFYETGSCLACTGKFFSQNYRLSFDFVRWRQSPPQ